MNFTSVVQWDIKTACIELRVISSKARKKRFWQKVAPSYVFSPLSYTCTTRAHVLFHITAFKIVVNLPISAVDWTTWVITIFHVQNSPINFYSGFFECLI